jgi:hypothetical protein
MKMKRNHRFVATIVLCGCVLLGANAASAQEATASGDTTTATASSSYSAPSSIRLGLQGRFSLLNTIYYTFPEATYGMALVPIITPGVRLLDERLYVGLGIGFWGWDSDAENDESSRAGFSMSPMAFYDLVSESIGALAIGGWLTIADISDTKDNGDKQRDGGFGFGLNLGAQVRGKISRALAIGGEFGWGFLMQSGDRDIFLHGVFGNILLEASVGL